MTQKLVWISLVQHETLAMNFRNGMETFCGQRHFVDTFYQNGWHFVDIFWGWLFVDIFGDISWTFLSTKCPLVGWLFVDTFGMTFSGHFWWHFVDIFVHEMSPSWMTFRGHFWDVFSWTLYFFKTKVHRWNIENYQYIKLQRYIVETLYPMKSYLQEISHVSKSLCLLVIHQNQTAPT